MTIETQLTIAIMVVTTAVLIQHFIMDSLYRRIDYQQGYNARQDTEIQNLESVLKLEREAKDNAKALDKSNYARTNEQLERGEL